VGDFGPDTMDPNKGDNADLSREIDDVYQKTYPFKKLKEPATSNVPPLKLKKELAGNEKTPDLIYTKEIGDFDDQEL
jgi:hypothetical protein